MRSTRSHSFNVLLSEYEYDRLNELRHLRNISAGAVLRQALHSLYFHSLKATPTCADGGRCFVPQMHTHPPPQLPTPNPNPPEDVPQ